MLKVPQTYDEFIHTPKKDLMLIREQIEDFATMQKMIRFFNQAKKEMSQNKLLCETTEVVNDTIYEDIHYGEI